MAFTLKIQKTAILVLALFVISIPKGHSEDSVSQLTPCKLNDPNNGPCLRDLLQHLLLRGTTTHSIDPYKLKKARVTVDNPNIRLNMNLTQVVIRGLSQSQMKDVIVTDGDHFVLNVNIPKVHIAGNYVMDGRVLLLNLAGKGEFSVDFSDIDVRFTLVAKAVEREGERYFNVETLKSHIKHLGNMHVAFANLFGSNQALTDSANDLFNQNWRELVEVLRPVIEESMDTSIRTQANKIFSNIPARSIILDAE
ncbi:circadian clock-controlled protein daywake-like [Musca vetustissima]|uniref:circadian clock-controlled protein daywake-like n=1 Tax=Musca vetustissima TaxID=27455 RepID=UPI002AB7CABE|nr:circadian clock-controlled protein daywake-like [Musca vetustissima]